MKKILAVFASVAAIAAMSVCAFAEAPANDALLISPAPGASGNPSAPVTPDDGKSEGTSDGADKTNTDSNSNTGSEGLALCAAVVLSGAVMIVSAKRK